LRYLILAFVKPREKNNHAHLSREAFKLKQTVSRQAKVRLEVDLENCWMSKSKSTDAVCVVLGFEVVSVHSF
jgi:hypothetical protein